MTLDSLRLDINLGGDLSEHHSNQILFQQAQLAEAAYATLRDDADNLIADTIPESVSKKKKIGAIPIFFRWFRHLVILCGRIWKGKEKICGQTLCRFPHKKKGQPNAVDPF